MKPYLKVGQVWLSECGNQSVKILELSSYSHDCAKVEITYSGEKETKIHENHNVISGVIPYILDIKTQFIWPTDKVREKHMRLDTGVGDKVIFAYPNNGMEADKKSAAENLTVGEKYTVSRIDVGGTMSHVYLEGVKSKVTKRPIGFNTVQFKNA